MTTRRAVARAGHVGDVESARAGLGHEEPTVRATALGALARLGRLTPADLVPLGSDPSPIVRRRVAQLAAGHAGFDLTALLDDDDATVIEMAVWACGEHESVDDDVLLRIIHLATEHADPLVREAAVAALGAIGDERGRSAVLAGFADKPAVRRRAVIASVAFEGDEIDAAVRRALDDKDWQVRDAAEELTRET